MSKWGIQLENTFIDIKNLTPGDWANINEIKKDVIKLENIQSADEALLCAFVAFIYLKSELESKIKLLQ